MSEDTRTADPGGLRTVDGIARCPHGAPLHACNDIAALTPEATAPERLSAEQEERLAIEAERIDYASDSEATAPQYETFTANDGEVSIRRTADSGGLDAAKVSAILFGAVDDETYDRVMSAKRQEYYDPNIGGYRVTPPVHGKPRALTPEATAPEDEK